MTDEKVLELALQYVKEFEKSSNCKVLFVTKSGSKLYGTDTPESDTDFKGIFAPTREQVFLKEDIDNFTRDTNNTKVKNTSEDIDFSMHSIYQFFNQLNKSETGGVDVLFSMFREDTIVYKNDEFINIIKEKYKIFLNKNMKSFIGYALGQTKKFGIKGARYDELVHFYNEMTKELSDKYDDKLETLFPYFQEYFEKHNNKYIKMVEARGPKSNGLYRIEPYISVLGKLFHGKVTVEYFLERIGKLYSQFGNRVITTSKSADNNKELVEELKELKKLI